MTDPDEVGPAIQRGLKTGHFRMLPRLLQADWHYGLMLERTNQSAISSTAACSRPP